MALKVNGETVALVDSATERADQDQDWEIEGRATAALKLTELDQTDPAGRFRLIVTGDQLLIQRAASAAWATATTLMTIDDTGSFEVSTPSYAAAGSKQALAGDLNLGAAAGATAPDSDFFAGVMGNVISTANLSATGNYLAGVIGMYSLSGTQASVFPKGAVLGIIAGDPVAVGANGAFVAVCDGDSGALTVAAGFTLFTLNSTAGSGFSFGLDLYRAAVSSFLAVDILTADIRLHDQQVIMSRSAALAATTALTSVILGTPVTPALAAGSLVISNVVADGDILLAAQTGGNTRSYIHIDASNISIEIVRDATGKLGFYGAAPVAQQTGVAVSAAGIHAALVNLGLITA